LLGEKSQKLSLGQNLLSGQLLLQYSFFIFINILLKLQHNILIWFCKLVAIPTTWRLNVMYQRRGKAKNVVLQCLVY